MELKVVVFSSNISDHCWPSGHLGYLEGQPFMHITRHPGTPEALRAHRSEAQEADVVILGPHAGLLGRDTDRSILLRKKYQEAIYSEDIMLSDWIAKEAEKEEIGSDPPLSGRLSEGSLLAPGTNRERLIVLVVSKDELIQRKPIRISRSIFQLSKKLQGESQLLRDIPPVEHPSLVHWLRTPGARFRPAQGPGKDLKLPNIERLNVDYLPHPSGCEFGVEMRAPEGCRIVAVPETAYWQGSGGSLASIVGNFLEIRFPDTLQRGWEMVKEKMLQVSQPPIGASALWRLACIQVYKAASRPPLEGNSKARRPHVLIVGSSGSGKEHLAQLAHHLSCPPVPKRFVPLNCAALTGHLTESQLFGAIEGSHSMAKTKTTGLVDAAAGGTLFLDEFQEFVEAPEAANHLLRFLETGDFTRLGDTKLLKSDAWVVAATNSLDLLDTNHKLYKTGMLFRFRSMIRVPNLLERWSDIPRLVRHLVQNRFADQPEQVESVCAAVIKRVDLGHIKAAGVRSLIHAVEYFVDSREFARQVEEWKKDSTSGNRNKKGGLRDADLVQLLKELCDLDEFDRQDALFKLPYPTRESLRKRVNSISNEADKVVCKEEYLDVIFPDARARKSRKTQI